MRRKLRFKGKRTPKGISGYIKGGTKYIWGRKKISYKNFL